VFWCFSGDKRLFGVGSIIEQPIEGGVSYEAEFRPEAIISGMYIYRVTMGEAIYNGKVVFKKE
jgi:hypothetical protein